MQKSPLKTMRAISYRRLCILIVALVATNIITGTSAVFMQNEYAKLTGQYIDTLKQLDSIKIKKSIKSVITNEEFIPTATSDVTKPHTTLDQLIDSINDNSIKLDPVRFYELSKQYGIDCGFALSVWTWETGWGSSSLWMYGNNPAGITCNGDYCIYDTKADGVEAMFKLLQSYTKGTISYVGIRSTPSDIRSAWSETRDVNGIVTIWKLITEEE